MVEPAPLEVLRDKLASPNPEARVVALMHAHRHGNAAWSLAPLVVERLRDEDPGVAWHVAWAFDALGAGSREAAEVLVGMLDDDDAMRVTRALLCLATVGPAASPLALEAVKAMVDDAEHGTDALVAAMQMAPADPDVRRALAAALEAEDYGRWSTPARHLERVDPDLQRWAFDRVEEGLEDDERRARSARLLSYLQHADGPRTLRVARRLLHHEDEMVLRWALFTLRQAHDEGCADDVLPLLQRGGEVALLAVEVLAHQGEAANRASDALLTLYRTTDGLRGRARVAKALVHHPPSDAWADVLLEDLRAQLEGDEMPRMYPLGDVVEALARVGRERDDVQVALRDAMHDVLRWWDADHDYQVREFLRSLLRGLEEGGRVYRALVAPRCSPPFGPSTPSRAGARRSRQRASIRRRSTRSKRTSPCPTFPRCRTIRPPPPSSWAS